MKVVTMATKGQNPWFLIEDVVSRVEDLCENARQAEAEAQRLRDEAIDLPGGKPLLTGGHHLVGADDGADPIQLRAEVRELLVALKARLNEHLTEREVYYCLFPLTIHFDEMVLRSLDAKVQRWAPLQKELFNIDNGGELFFGAIDALLLRDETLPLIFEVFLFCLQNGFKGTYLHATSRLDEYIGRLKARIPKLDHRPVHFQRRRRRSSDQDGIELIDFPWRYYGWGVGAALGIFLSLYVVGYLDHLLMS